MTEGASAPPDPPLEHRSGFVGLAGVPNAGKSTLLNRLVGQKVAIVSNRPQTTRHRICGIMTEPGIQAVFVDIPGILKTGEDFNRGLVEVAAGALRGCDAVIHLRVRESAGSEDEERVFGILASVKAPILQVWNKMDLDPAPPPAEVLTDRLPYRETFFISARTGRGVPDLVEGVRRLLPAGPPLYPGDDVSDRDLRFLCAELVREKIFLFLRQEVPYGIACVTEDFKERPDGKTYIRVEILTEKDSHKAILLGAKGELVKKIGSAARRDIEQLCECPVYLDLWVKTRPGWRSNEAELDRLGLKPPKDRG